MIDVNDVANLCQNYAERLAQKDRIISSKDAELQHLRNWCGAYRLLLADHGRTENDAKARWKRAGYGGL